MENTIKVAVENAVEKFVEDVKKKQRVRRKNS